MKEYKSAVGTVLNIDLKKDGYLKIAWGVVLEGTKMYVPSTYSPSMLDEFCFCIGIDKGEIATVLGKTFHVQVFKKDNGLYYVDPDKVRAFVEPSSQLKSVNRFEPPTTSETLQEKKINAKNSINGKKGVARKALIAAVNPIKGNAAFNNGYIKEFYPSIYEKAQEFLEAVREVGIE